MLRNFLRILQSITKDSAESPPDVVRYCDRFLELLIDLEAQLPTRRFFNTLLEDHHVLLFCRFDLLFSLFCF
jgi:intron-binding protein aquarius